VESVWKVCGSCVEAGWHIAIPVGAGARLVQRVLCGWPQDLGFRLTRHRRDQSDRQPVSRDSHQLDLVHTDNPHQTGNFWDCPPAIGLPLPTQGLTSALVSVLPAATRVVHPWTRSCAAIHAGLRSSLHAPRHAAR